MPRPALFRRLPGFRPPGSSSPILPSDAATSFPELTTDFDTLEKELFPGFREFDLEALRAQHGFRLAQILLIVGGVMATVLGAVQAALRHAAWAGVAEAVGLVVLGAVFQLAGDLNFKQDYLDQRLKAERLRAECFFYLARVGRYDEQSEENARRLLHRRVALIRTGRPDDA